MPKIIAPATVTEMPIVYCPLSGETADANNAGDTGIEELIVQPVTNALGFIASRCQGLAPAADPYRKIIDFDSCNPRDQSGADDWTTSNLVTRNILTQAHNTTAVAAFEITSQLPARGHIVGFGALLTGASADTIMPASMPMITLCRCGALVEATETDLYTVTDPSATVGALQTVHLVESDPVDTSIAGYRWFIKLRGESGTNSHSGLLYHYAFVDTTE